ncbi:MAG TPA: glutathione synthase [Candidatus Omnitrophica bacterium]|nr:glutathione synthase [Candidatus Omnitrophota bacterium]HCI45138.1 glutathione synthase [Candidatus Omnitrophota bacterium]
MNFIFLMDPLHTVIMEKDTSFILMLGAHRRGHKVFFLPDGGITRLNGKLHFHAVEVTPQQIAEKPFIEHKSIVLKESDVHAVFVRGDPPFDEQYLLNTWLLDLLPKSIPVINRPSGIRTVNEKIWATQFTAIIPPTLVGRNRKDLLDFLAKEKNIVAKPTGGHGGQSVFHVQPGGVNANVILETLTHNWNREIILQKFVPESKDGDKRILLLNGEPLGAVLRVHAQDDHRNNFFAGGKPSRAEVSTRDRQIISTLKPRLQELGLYLVGIDVIGEYLIEVNVTSPTGLQEINRLYGTRGEDKILDFVENLINQ